MLFYIFVLLLEHWHRFLQSGDDCARWALAGVGMLCEELFRNRGRPRGRAQVVMIHQVTVFHSLLARRESISFNFHVVTSSVNVTFFEVVRTNSRILPWFPVITPNASSTGRCSITIGKKSAVTHWQYIFKKTKVLLGKAYQKLFFLIRLFFDICKELLVKNLVEQGWCSTLAFYDKNFP